MQNEKQMDLKERTKRSRRARRGNIRESCKIFSKKNNPERLSNYIYLSCVVLLGRPCGLPDCSMVHFSHYLILDGEQKRKKLGFRVSWGQIGSQWEGCGKVPGLKDPNVVKASEVLKFHVFDYFAVFCRVLGQELLGALLL